MRAVYLERHGAPDVLRIKEEPDPTPGAGEIAVRVEAIGLNYAEVLSRKGLYGWTPKKPYVLGMEATGVVDELGEGVDSWSKGDRVILGMQSGAYADRIVVRADRALPARPGFTVEENAAYAVHYMTAWVALVEMGRMRAGDRVVVTAAAGGVGTAAVQIGSRFGCEVVALASTDEKLGLARELGAAITVRYGDAGFAARLREAVGERGVDIVLETVGGDVFRACDAVIAPFGRMVVAGYAGLDYSRLNPLSWWRVWRDAPRMDIESMYKGSKGMLSTHLGYISGRSTLRRAVWERLGSFVDEHGIRPRVGHVLPFEEVAAAHALMESRGSTGKIVLRV